MSADLDYEKLDPGIRKVVRLLNADGFETYDSGDGVSKPPEERVFDYPHVFVRAAIWQIDDACHVIDTLFAEHGVHFEPIGENPWRPHLQVTWDPFSGEDALIEVGGIDDAMLAGARG